MKILIAMGIIHLVAMISPGPDFLVVVKNSLKYSSRIGSYTAVGIALGLVIHMTYCILGLGLVISQSILLFNVIKYLGAAYLICIGIASFLSKDEPLQLDAKKDVQILSPMRAVKMGFLVNALNPKATLAFVSLFSAFITPETPLRISLAFAGFVIVSALVWFSFVASIFTFQKVRYIFEKAKTRVDRTIGILFVSLGLKVVDV
jgi:RhtB (resistance to homoserine/threonine) family protein